ncbi:hypothetical protein HCUR_00022 [Holospora curviuscula]|uniref:Uncharacterized protein n=1 Tax=Holospora curviuscula TaxID=1082868 RepID=A0A2S5RI55_9PROT|nr:hypothetical protein HCUR_00022 [Holospora curviuscula]
MKEVEEGSLDYLNPLKDPRSNRNRVHEMSEVFLEALIKELNPG